MRVWKVTTERWCAILGNRSKRVAKHCYTGVSHGTVF